MQDFGLFFQIGREHIADLGGNDHILFVAALCVRYLINDWKQVLILVTAFTIGHSLTLALSVLNIFSVSSYWIEFLIAVTIMLTAVSNGIKKQFRFTTRFYGFYFIALLFGLIHGLGFSNYLKSLMGKSSSVVTELLAFNLGLEVGQLQIVLFTLLTSHIFVNFVKIDRREWVLFISGGIFGLSLLMAIERFPF